MFYLGLYDVDDYKIENRNISLAATNKMTYICSALNRAGYDVEIVSASGSKNCQAYPGRVCGISDKTKLRIFPTRGDSKNIVVKVFNRLVLMYKLFDYLFHNIQRGEPVLVYHSLGYVFLVKLLKYIIGFKLILEVEEFYSDVTGKSLHLNMEMGLFRIADGYLLATELLNDRLNSDNNKPSLAIYGTYKVEKECRREFGDIFEKDKIHCVYAGTFDPRKGGGVAAAAAAEYLSEKYHIHIIGFGSVQEVENMKKLINEISKKTKATVTYDGLYSGQEYISFLQNCHIGLSTQMPGAKFNDTSFPSKVLSYLANGLRVVSVKIKVLERSKISNLMYYYEGNNPKDIANAIKSIDFNQKYDGRDIVRNFDKDFVERLDNLIKSV